jgi:glutamate-1-semialdehyde 2,1-aminomutase
VFDGAYHGSLYYFSHGASPLNMPIPTVFSTFNDIDAMRRDIAAHAATLAAVIVEPMQGGAGALPGTAEFLTALREETARHGVCLVFDEVMTSRTHPGGLQALHGIRPDLVTLGKYLGGGITFGAFGGRADIMERFDPSRPHHFPHGGTFNNNVLAMTAGARVMDEVLTDDALNAMNGLGVGSIFGIHFHAGPIRNIGDLDAAEHGREAKIANLKKLFHLDMFEAGIYISRRVMGNLSLATTPADTQQLLGAVDEFMASRGGLVREAVAG